MPAQHMAAHAVINGLQTTSTSSWNDTRETSGAQLYIRTNLDRSVSALYALKWMVKGIYK